MIARCWEGLVFFSFVTERVQPGHRGVAVRRPHARRRPADRSQRCRQRQHTSFAFNQVLDDHGVLASIGSVGDA
jgi:hypothetical protein